MKGKEHVSLAEGTLGISMRVFVPIFSETGEQLGAVAVGISADNVKRELRKVDISFILVSEWVY